MVSPMGPYTSALTFHNIILTLLSDTKKYKFATKLTGFRGVNSFILGECYETRFIESRLPFSLE